MILLDENIRQDQGDRLGRWRIRLRLLIEDFARSGIQDLDIIPLLHRLKQPTFFTHDQDFFQKCLVHARYSLAWLEVFDGDAATFIRLFLRHPLFGTSAKRMGGRRACSRSRHKFLAWRFPLFAAHNVVGKLSVFPL
jgi:hypothetical protein